MTKCEKAKRDFFRAEILAHWLMDTKGKGKAYAAAERASERAHERGRGCAWQRPRRAR